MTVLAVMAGGAIGAVLRHLVRERAAGRGRPALGTVLVNAAGAGALGLAIGADWPGWVLAGVTTGALGAFTTVSSFALDVVNEAERPAGHGGRAAVGYVVITLAAGLGAVCSTLA